MNHQETDNRPGLERWQKIYERAGHRCIYCGEDLLRDLHIYHSATEDHLYPRSPKDASLPRGAEGQCNVVPACHVCNALKADFIPAEALTSPADFFSETAPNKLRFVKADKRRAYIALVWKYIEPRRIAREQEMLAERERMKWQPAAKTP